MATPPPDARCNYLPVGNENANNCDKYQPTYCAALYQNVTDYSKFGKGKFAIEVGCGTGQATQPFLDTGGHVTAFEIGTNLADYTENKFSDYKNLTVINKPFEDYRFEENSVELVFAATSFHWVSSVGNGEPGYPLAHKILKPDSVLACWWNTPVSCYENPELKKAMQDVYTKYAPEIAHNETADEFEQTYIKRCVHIAWRHWRNGFYGAMFNLYHTYRTFSADDYIGLLHTYSDHMSLQEDARIALFDAIRSIIAKHGQIIIQDRIDLHMGKKH